MIDLIARLLLLLRRRRPFILAGIYWCYCSHRSHDRGLRCYRWTAYDGYCTRHNATCYFSCTGQDDDVPEKETET
jgi:hypothetical protein